MLWDPTVGNMLTLFNLAFPQICITTQKQSKQIQLEDKVIGSEDPSQMAWAGCPANVRTQHSSRKQLLLLERKMFPEGRVGKEDGTEMGNKREMSKEKPKPPLKALLYSPAQGTAARGIHRCPKGSPPDYWNDETDNSETAVLYSLINYIHSKRKHKSKSPFSLQPTSAPSFHQCLTLIL